MKQSVSHKWKTISQKCDLIMENNNFQKLFCKEGQNYHPKVASKLSEGMTSDVVGKQKKRI